MTAAPTPVALLAPTSLPRDAFEGPAAEEAARLFSVLQDRHVPVTPTLAAALVRHSYAADPVEDPTWGRAWTLAGAVIGLPGRFGRGAAWRRAAPIFRITVAEPVLRRAAAVTGLAPLVCRGPTRLAGARRGAEAAASAWGRLDAAVGDLLVSADGMGERFWPVAAMRLMAEATAAGTSAQSPRDVRDGVPRGPARPDPALVRLVYGLAPEFPDADAPSRRQLTARRRSRRIRAGHRPREDGVEGIIQSRRVEDVQDALPTEFAWPRPVRTLRFVEEGFRILHRPPARRPSRDLLSLTLCEADQGEGPALLAKAAWIDATLRLQPMLADLGMPRSELGWGAETPLGPATAALGVGERRGRAPIDPMRLPPARMATALSTSSLAPRVFDTLPDAVIVTAEADETAAGARAALARALLRRCAAEAHDGGPRGPARSADPADHGVVLAVRIRPEADAEGALAQSSVAAEREALRSAFGLGPHPAARFAGLLLPPRLEPGARFVAVADGAVPQEIVVEDPAEAADASPGALARTLGALSLWFTLLTLEAVDG